MTDLPKDFTINHLLDDDNFIRLIKRTDTSPDARMEWSAMLEQHPDKRVLLLQAAGIIELMKDQDQADNPESRSRTWNNVYSGSMKERIKITGWMKVAAIFVLAVCVAALVKWHVGMHNEQVRWQTGHSESKKVQLPDHSIIILGNNSSLTYEKNWNKSLPREVWLTGEARFEVVHINKDANHISKEEKFIVHVNNELDVEVLGTVFDVVKKQDKLAVILESGAIFLNRPGKKGILLKPGEQAELDESENVLTKLKTIEPHLKGNLSQKSVELDNTSVADIIKLLERTYHRKIETTDSGILDRRIDGSFPLFNEEDAWFTLSNILDIDIEIRNDGVLVLKPKKN